MLSGGLGKVALLQPLPALAITPRRRAVGLTAGPLQEVVARIAIETAPGLGAGAVRGQAAASAHYRSCPIVIVTSMAIKVMAVKEATRGTLVSVVTFIILKTFCWINVLLLVVAQTAAQVAHVRTNALTRQGNEVRARAILAIGHHRPRLMSRVLPVLLKQAAQLRPIVANAIGRLERGNDSSLVIQCPMALVTRITLPAAPLPHQRRVRIGRYSTPLVDRPATTATSLGRFLLRTLLQLGQSDRDHRVERSIGPHQARIGVQLASLDQPRLQTLRYTLAKEPGKDFRPPTSPRLREHAVIRDLVFQAVTQKPEVIDPQRDDPHQFPLTAHVIPEEQEHHLRHDHRID